MVGVKLPSKWIDENHYRTAVLQLPQQATEAAIDDRLRHEADQLGVSPLKITTETETETETETDIDHITASMSATTIASESMNQSSILSRSTAPTSCSSSEHRPATRSSHHSETMFLPREDPTILADIEKKRKSGFRHGIRKMTGFSRKRKSPTVSPLTLHSLDSRSRTGLESVKSPPDIETTSMDFELNSNATAHLTTTTPSIRSTKSSSVWSNKVSATTKSSYDNADTLLDHEALRRTMESTELIDLRDRQLEERRRFLQYQSQLLGRLWTDRDHIKDTKRTLHTQITEEQVRKNEKAVEDLESRQLEEELKMVQDHESEKRSILARLRHMEAYCQNPSPPPTPVEFTFSGSDGTASPVSIARGSVDSTAVVVLPERKVTDKDYHNLASCYRERDAMDNLQASKINVLRGKQKRAVENFVLRREKDLEKLELQQAREMEEVDREYGVKEAECRAEFGEKRQVLERRWNLQAMVEKAKMEQKTGLAYEVIPIVVLNENETDADADPDTDTDTTNEYGLAS